MMRFPINTTTAVLGLTFALMVTAASPARAVDDIITFTDLGTLGGDNSVAF